MSSSKKDPANLSKRSVWGLFLALAAGLAGADAGEVRLRWNPVPGAAGYYVEYGEEDGVWTHRDNTGAAVEWTVRGLTDCRSWHFRVLAYNSQRQTGEPSRTLVGWPRPEISTSEIRVRQGDMLTLDVQGANFRPTTTFRIDNPHVRLDDVVYLGCGRMQVFASVGPAGPGARAAPVGSYRLQAVTRPFNVSSRVGGRFVVDLDLRRFDVDRSTKSTEDRLDGGDLSRITFHWSGCDDTTSPSCDDLDATRYQPDLDFDGNGWIDGTDLALVASHRWGRCWSPRTGDWTDSPLLYPAVGLLCPTVTP